MSIQLNKNIVQQLLKTEIQNKLKSLFLYLISKFNIFLVKN